MAVRADDARAVDCAAASDACDAGVGSAVTVIRTQRVPIVGQRSEWLVALLADRLVAPRAPSSHPPLVASVVIQRSTSRRRCVDGSHRDRRRRRVNLQAAVSSLSVPRSGPAERIGADQSGPVRLASSRSSSTRAHHSTGHRRVPSSRCSLAARRTTGRPLDWSLTD